MPRLSSFALLDYFKEENMRMRLTKKGLYDLGYDFENASYLDGNETVSLQRARLIVLLLLIYLDWRAVHYYPWLWMNIGW